jgi:hypothetical protein
MFTFYPIGSKFYLNKFVQVNNVMKKFVLNLNQQQFRTKSLICNAMQIYQF